MSRTSIIRGEFIITAGWDRPCRNFFGSVETEDDEDFPFYSTIDDPDSDGMGGFPTLDQVKEKIEAIVGILPVEFWEKAAILDMNQIRMVEDSSN